MFAGRLGCVVRKAHRFLHRRNIDHTIWSLYRFKLSTHTGRHAWQVDGDDQITLFVLEILYLSSAMMFSSETNAFGGTVQCAELLNDIFDPCVDSCAFETFSGSSRRRSCRR